MPRPAHQRRADIPTVRLTIAVAVLLFALPARATLLPPPVRLAILFGRVPWHHVNQVDLLAPRGWILARGVVNGR